MNLDVVCAGSAGFDIFISGRELKPSQFIRDNELVMRNDSIYNVDHTVYEVGGSGINSAITFARQGIKTGCIAKTGKDNLANQIKITAKHEEVEHELLINSPEHHTDMNIHIVTERSHAISLVYKNSIKSLRVKEIKFPDLSTRLLYLSELPSDFKIFKFFENWARRGGAQLVLNIQDAKQYKRHHFNFVLASVDRIMMPISFAIKLFDGVTDPQEILRQLNALGAKSILLYDINNEAYAYEDSTVYSCGRYKNINPLDSTGAEDAFAASYMASVFQQKTIPECLTIASANACSVMGAFGARAGILKKPALRTIKVKIGVL